MAARAYQELSISAEPLTDAPGSGTSSEDEDEEGEDFLYGLDAQDVDGDADEGNLFASSNT
jgi:hypothetical protein